MGDVAQERILFRAMKEDVGLPAVIQSARGLGVRANGGNPDVHPDIFGNVHPGEGMSVAPDDPLLLPEHRRPPELLGSGGDPLWQVAEFCLSDDLRYRTTSTTHGQIEPGAAMPLDDYRAALAATRVHWSRTSHD